MSGLARCVAVVAGAVLAGSAVAACASLPASGNIRISTQHGSGGNSTGVQVVPVPPGKGWTPTQIVNGFMAASAAIYEPNAKIARDYLTIGLAKQWRPGSAATVVIRPNVYKEPPPSHQITGEQPPTAVVVVRSHGLATMTTTRTYEAGSLVVSPSVHTFAFDLSEINGKWRISSILVNNKPASPRLLLLTRPDFERVYQPRNLYYFPAGAAGASPGQQALIPEPVFIPQQTVQRTVTGMVTSLLSSPPSSSWLTGAAKTAFPRGTRLISDPVSGVKAYVNLGNARCAQHTAGAASRTSAKARCPGIASASRAQLQRMAAQLYWTLTSSPYATSPATQIRSVVLEVNGRIRTQILQPSDARWMPGGQVVQNATDLYFQAPSVTGVPSVKVQQAGKKPASLSVPASAGTGPFTAIAVTPGQTKQVVLAGCRGKDLYLIPQWSGAQAAHRTLPAKCTSLSWDVHRNLWVTAGGSAYELRGAGSLDSAAAPKLIPVSCPYLSLLRQPATISSLRVAPDGVRVAMIVRFHSGSTQVDVGAIGSGSSSLDIGQTGSLLRVGSDISHPVAVTWLNPDQLLVLNQSASRSSLYEVPLDGGTSTQVATPSGTVLSIAASWPAGGSSQVALGLAGSGDQPASVKMSNAALLDRGWSSVAKAETTPVFPG